MDTWVTDDRQLLALAKAGDEDAFNALVETHRAELLAYCYRMLGSIQDASQQSVPRALGDDRLASVAARYADALETGDVDALLALLTEDATWCMPPMPTWFQGHEAIRSWLVRDPLAVRWRHIATSANGQLAVGCYLYSPVTGAYEPAVIDVLTFSPADGKISAVTAFMQLDGPADPAATFARFDLPATPPAH